MSIWRQEIRYCRL